MGDPNRQYKVKVSRTKDGHIIYDLSYIVDIYDNYEGYDYCQYTMFYENGPMAMEEAFDPKVDEVDIICEAMKEAHEDHTRLFIWKYEEKDPWTPIM